MTKSYFSYKKLKRKFNYINGPGQVSSFSQTEIYQIFSITNFIQHETWNWFGFQPNMHTNSKKRRNNTRQGWYTEHQVKFIKDSS